MNSFVELCCHKRDDESSGGEVFDEDAVGLSHVGDAVHKVLGRHHNSHHQSMWNVTTGRVIGSVDDTPRKVWDTPTDPGKSNDDWFPEKLAAIISRTEAWCDIMSLGPPDGKFLTAFQSAMRTLAKRSKTSEHPIVVRMLFGNIAGMPVNCNGVIKALTKDLPTDAKLQLWVGAWRKGFSWNHAKLIAVDGVYLHTGGHNLWDAHYLSSNPVHDLSFELEGRVARDGHRFANQQWQFIESKQSTCIGCVVDAMPDYLPLAMRTRVTVSEWPKNVVPVFPPQFTKSKVANVQKSRLAKTSPGVPLISIGRQGTMVYQSRPSDDAIMAMINSSQKIIRFVLQDLGPVCLPGTKKALPGLVWPKAYLAAIGNAIYERGVDIEMVVSNPNSIPGGLKGTEANYGNGWNCVDVAAEIIKAIQKHHTDVDDAKLRSMVTENLRICFVRHDKSSKYEDGKTIGLHSKHFIVDDKCCYIGSQNLYMCDLAEWGIIVDNEAEVKKMLDDYFLPMWRNSYTGEDVDVDKVMDGLNVDRDGETIGMLGLDNADTGQQMMPHGTGAEYYDIEQDGSDVACETDPPVEAKEEMINGTDEMEESTPSAEAEEDDAVSAPKTKVKEDVNPGNKQSPTATDDSEFDERASLAPALIDEREPSEAAKKDAADSAQETDKQRRASHDAEESPRVSDDSELDEEESLAVALSVPESAPGVALVLYKSPNLTPPTDEESHDSLKEYTTALANVPQNLAETEQRDESTSKKGLQFNFCGFAESFRIASE